MQVDTVTPTGRIVLNRALPAGSVAPGRSATVSYFRRLRSLILAEDDFMLPMRGQDSFAPEARSEPLLPAPEVYTLPERSTADSLVALVMQDGYMRWPVFPPNMFQRLYEGVYTDSTNIGEDRPLAFAFMHLIFAIGQKFSNQPQQADLHYRKAMQITADSTAMSLLRGQIAFLTCYYSFLSTPSIVDERLQRDTAEAVNSAIMLGLHKEPIDVDPETAESRKRLWRGLTRLDRFTGIVLGRPVLSKIVESTCSPSSPLPREPIEVTARFEALNNLSETWFAMLTELYQGAEADFSTLHSMVDIEDEVEEWRRRLDPALIFHIDKHDALGLQCRELTEWHSFACQLYLFTRMVLFRPALEYKLSQPAPKESDVPWKTLVDDAWDKACNSCIEAARRLIRHTEVAKMHLTVAGTLTFITDSLFAANTVLLSARWLDKWTNSMDRDYSLANEMLHDISPLLAAKLNALAAHIVKMKANKMTQAQHFGDVLQTF